MPDPDPDADFRRRAALLWQRQLRGEAPLPGRISQARLAAELQISRRQLRKHLLRAISVLRKTFRDDPEVIALLDKHENQP